MASAMSSYTPPMVHGTSALAPQAMAMPVITAQAAPAPIVAQAAPMAQPEPAPVAIPVAAEPVLELTIPEPVEETKPEPVIELKAEIKAEPTPAPREPVLTSRPMVARAEPVAADPFAAAAIANGAREKPRESLFARVTGLGRRQPEPQPTREAPVAETPAPTPMPAPAPRMAMPTREPVRTQPQQAKLGNLDPSDRLKPAHDDDLLEIPAFLRRQAN
jgi:cell division protein FtsZ